MADQTVNNAIQTVPSPITLALATSSSYVFSAGLTARRACPEGAKGLSPGFQPWEPNTSERRALKGRQIESIYDAEVGGSDCRTPQLCTLFLGNVGCEIHLVSGGPFRVNHHFWAFPGLNPWLSPLAPSGQRPSGRTMTGAADPTDD
jgi:hypothetical protein